MIRRKFLFLAALTGLAIAGLAPPARADIQISLTSGSQTIYMQNPVSSGPVIIPAFSFGPGNLLITTATGTSNSPGNPLFSFNTAGIGNTNTLDIENLTGSTQTVTITVSSQGFTSPNSPPPLMVTDTVSGTVLFGTVTGTAQGFADATNTLVGTTTGAGGIPILPTVPGTGGALPGTAFSAPLLNFSGTTGTSFAASGAAVGFSPDGNTYSLTFTETITLSAFASVQLTGGNVQTFATPAPAGVLLALSGLPFLGAISWMRRRKNPVACAPAV